MAKGRVTEFQDEVFAYTTGTEKCLIIIGKDNHMFKLEPHDCLGKATEEKRRDIESIGIFDIY